MWMSQAAGAADDELDEVEEVDDELSFAPPVDEPESDLPESLFASVLAATPAPPERLSVR
jgi:hypothetical protein